MAKKKLEDYSTDELRKAYKTMKAIFLIELTILIAAALFILYSKVTDRFELNLALYILPVMMIAVMMGPIMFLKGFKKELERRGETM